MKALFLLLLGFPLVLSAQHALFFEAAGSGGLASVNYEKAFFQGKYQSYDYRLGFSFAPIDKNNGTAFVFPLMINAKIGDRHCFEYGLGQSISVTTKGSVFLMGVAQFGYRYNFKNEWFFVRANYTPIISYLVDFQWQHWGGVSFGYYFGRTAQ